MVVQNSSIGLTADVLTDYLITDILMRFPMVLFCLIFLILSPNLSVVRTFSEILRKKEKVICRENK